MSKTFHTRCYSRAALTTIKAAIVHYAACTKVSVVIGNQVRLGSKSNNWGPTRASPFIVYRAMDNEVIALNREVSHPSLWSPKEPDMEDIYSEVKKMIEDIETLVDGEDVKFHLVTGMLHIGDDILGDFVKHQYCSSDYIYESHFPEVVKAEEWLTLKDMRKVLADMDEPSYEGKIDDALMLESKRTMLNELKTAANGLELKFMLLAKEMFPTFTELQFKGLNGGWTTFRNYDPEFYIKLDEEDWKYIKTKMEQKASADLWCELYFKKAKPQVEIVKRAETSLEFKRFTEAVHVLRATEKQTGIKSLASFIVHPETFLVDEYLNG